MTDLENKIVLLTDSVSGFNRDNMNMTLSCEVVGCNASLYVNGKHLCSSDVDFIKKMVAVLRRYSEITYKQI